MHILVINPGATSTKLAVFQEKQEEWRSTLLHSQEDLAPFHHVNEQTGYRLELILQEVEKADYHMADFAAVVGRGGLLRHIPSGTYKVNQRAVDDMNDPPMGEHAANLGVLICDELTRRYGMPSYFVDPVSVDELEPVARISGHAAFERQSFFHALNQKSVARRAAEKLRKPYEDCNFIVVHMGGGVSVAAHRKGKVVDVYNVKDEGAFSMDRGGSLPVTRVIDYCFSGKSYQEVKRELGTQAGMVSYLGTKDLREVEARMDAGDEKAALLFDALSYQLCKDIGAMAAVLCGQIDAIAFTGGMAHSQRLCRSMEERVGFLAPVMLFPGEEEMAALAMGAWRVLTGEQQALDY